MRTDIITSKDLDANGVPKLPEQFSYIMSQNYIRHEVPTSDPGFYHRHRVHAAGNWDMKLAIDKFKLQLRQIPGAIILNDIKIVRTAGVGAFSNTLDIFYAVMGPAPTAAKDNRMVGAMMFPYC